MPRLVPARALGLDQLAAIIRHHVVAPAVGEEERDRRTGPDLLHRFHRHLRERRGEPGEALLGQVGRHAKQHQATVGAADAEDPARIHFRIKQQVVEQPVDEVEVFPAAAALRARIDPAVRRFRENDDVVAHRL